MHVIHKTWFMLAVAMLF